MAEPDITDRLVAVREGDPEAMQQVFEMVHRELYVLARRELARRRVPTTLSSTALVNEAYLRLVDKTRVAWQDRNHFFAVASRAMRYVLVDHARNKLAEKRGGGVRHETFEETRVGLEERTVDILALDEALARLERLNDRLVKVVELRFFGGLSVEETAELLNVTPRTVKRDWRTAKAFLFDALRDGASRS